MKLAPFLLDDWISQKHTANPPIEFDLASSTGPVWTFRELLALEDGAFDRLLTAPVSYISARGSIELREEIARMQGVHPDDVQIVTGGSEALLAMLFLAAEPGANIVLPYPEYPAYTPVAESFGVSIRRYYLRPERQFRIDPEEIRALVDERTKFVIVNSPHNPTGAVLSLEEMERIHDFCAERGVMFVSDEVYHPIYHGVDLPSASRLPHATVLGDFSKALCLSGLRTGWIVERDPVRRKALLTARNYFTICNTAMGERLAALAIRRRDAIYGRAIEVAGANLKLLDQFLERHSKRLQWVRPLGGMTAFPWLTDGGDGREFCLGAMRAGVLIVPGDCFGMPGHFRLGFAASGESFAAGLERLDRMMSGNAAAR